METSKKPSEFLKRHETECVILLLAAMPTLILVIVTLMSQLAVYRYSNQLISEFADNLFEDQIAAQKIENNAIVFQLNAQVQRISWQMRILSVFFSKVVEGDVTYDDGYVASMLNTDRAYTDDEDPNMLALFHRSQFLVSSWHQINASYVSDLNNKQIQELKAAQRIDPIWRSIKYENNKTDSKRLLIRDVYIAHDYDGLIYMSSVNTTYVNYPIPEGCLYLGKWRLDLRCRYYYEPTMNSPGLQLFDPRVFYTADTPYIASPYCSRYLKKISADASAESSYSRYAIVCTQIDLQDVSSYFSSLNSYSKYRMVIDPFNFTVIYSSEMNLSKNSTTTIYEAETNYLKDQESASLFLSNLQGNANYLMKNISDLQVEYAKIEQLQSTFEYERNGTSCFAILNHVTMIDKPLQREVDTGQASRFQLKLAFLFLDVLSKDKMKEYAEQLNSKVNSQSLVFLHATWSLNLVILLIDLYCAFILAARLLLPVAHLTAILQSISFSSKGVQEQQNFQQLTRMNSKATSPMPSDRALKRFKSTQQIHRVPSIAFDKSPLHNQFRVSELSDISSGLKKRNSTNINLNKNQDISHQGLGLQKVIHIQTDTQKYPLSPTKHTIIGRLNQQLKDNASNSNSKQQNNSQQEFINSESDSSLEDQFESLNTEMIFGQKEIQIENDFSDIDTNEIMFLSSDMQVLFETFQNMFRILSFTTQNLYTENESISLLNLNNQVQHFEKFGNHRALGVCNNNIGFLHYNSKRYKEALQYFKAAVIHAKYELGFYNDEISETTAGIIQCLRHNSQFDYRDLSDLQSVHASVSDEDMNDDKQQQEIEVKKDNVYCNNRSMQGKNYLEPLMTPTLEGRHTRKFSCDELINHTENANNNINSQGDNQKNENNYGQQQNEKQEPKQLLKENNEQDIQQVESPKIFDIFSNNLLKEQDNTDNYQHQYKHQSNFSKIRDKSPFFQPPLNLSFQTQIQVEREELCWSLYNRRMNYAKAMYSYLNETQEGSFLQMWEVFEEIAIENTAISQLFLPPSYKREMINYQLISLAYTMQGRQYEAKETLNRFSTLYINNLKESKQKKENKGNNMIKMSPKESKIKETQVGQIQQQQQMKDDKLNANEISLATYQESRLDTPAQSFHPASNVSIANDLAQIHHKSSQNNSNINTQGTQGVKENLENLKDNTCQDQKNSDQNNSLNEEGQTNIIAEVDSIENSSEKPQKINNNADISPKSILSRKQTQQADPGQTGQVQTTSPTQLQQQVSSNKLRLFLKPPIPPSNKSSYKISPLQMPLKSPLYRHYSSISEFSQLGKNFIEADDQSTSPSRKTLMLGGTFQHARFSKEVLASYSSKSKSTIQDTLNQTDASRYSVNRLLSQPFQLQQKGVHKLINKQLIQQGLSQWTKIPMRQEQGSSSEESHEKINQSFQLTKYHQFIMNERSKRTQKTIIKQSKKLSYHEKTFLEDEEFISSIPQISKITALHRLNKTPSKYKKTMRIRKLTDQHGARSSKTIIFKPPKRFFCVRKVDKTDALSKSEFSSDVLFAHYIILQALFQLQKGNFKEAAELLTVPIEQCEFYFPSQKALILYSLHDILKRQQLNDNSLDEMVRNCKMSDNRMFRIVVASTGHSQFSLQRTYSLCSDILCEILFKPTDWFGILSYDHSEKLFSSVMAFTKKSIIAQSPDRFDNILKDALLYSFNVSEDSLSSSGSQNGDGGSSKVNSKNFKNIDSSPQKHSQNYLKTKRSSSNSSQSSKSSSVYQSMPESLICIDENVADTKRGKKKNVTAQEDLEKENDEEISPIQVINRHYGYDLNLFKVQNNNQNKVLYSEQFQSLARDYEKSNQQPCISSLSKYPSITETILNRQSRQQQLQGKQDQHSTSQTPPLNPNNQNILENETLMNIKPENNSRNQHPNDSLGTLIAPTKPTLTHQLSLKQSINQWNNSSSFNKSQDNLSEDTIFTPPFSRNNSMLPMKSSEDKHSSSFKRFESWEPINFQLEPIPDEGVHNLGNKEQTPKSLSETNQQELQVQTNKVYKFDIHKASSHQQLSPGKIGSTHFERYLNPLTSQGRLLQSQQHPQSPSSSSLLSENTQNLHEIRPHSFTFSKPLSIVSRTHNHFSPSKSPPKSASIPQSKQFSKSMVFGQHPPKSASLNRLNKQMLQKDKNNQKNQSDQFNFPLKINRTSEQTFHLAIQASLKNFLLDSSSKISCYLSEKRYRLRKNANSAQDRQHQMEIKTFLIYATDEELLFSKKQLFDDLCKLLKELRVELLVLFLNSKQQLEEYSRLEDVMLGAMSVVKFFASEQKLLQYIYNQREHLSKQNRPLIVEHF